MNGLLPSFSVSGNTSLSSYFSPLTESEREIGKKKLQRKTAEKGAERVYTGLEMTQNCMSPCSAILSFELGKIAVLLRLLSQLQCDNASESSLSSVFGTQ